MRTATLLSIFTVSLFHTLIPSHWLCFVVVGRAQMWKTRQTMLVAALAGLLHVVSTVTLGVILNIAGAELAEEGLIERIGAVVILGLGLVYLLLHTLHGGHHHEQDRTVTNRLAFAALLFSLTLSPCSAAIPLLFTISQSVAETAAMAVVLLVTTLGTMLLLVGLTSLGIEKLKFSVVDRYEKLIVGLVLVAVGAGLLLLDHGHGHAH